MCLGVVTSTRFGVRGPGRSCQSVLAVCVILGCSYQNLSLHIGRLGAPVLPGGLEGQEVLERKWWEIAGLLRELRVLSARFLLPHC